MSATTLGFFIAGLAAFFGLALAVQMRIFAGLALKRAARAQYPELEDGPARFVVVHAVNGSGILDDGDTAAEAVGWIRAEYPAALRHIRLARKATAIMAVLLFAIIVAWRLTTGGS